MEFGIFIQGWVPGPPAHDSDAEHRALLAEADLVECADRHEWKWPAPPSASTSRRASST
jgi:hypothetical protein